MANLRIGIDVGGTNTDAVLMKDKSILAWTKTPTTSDVSGGVNTALRSVLTDASVNTKDIDVVMIGTTHFTNAFVEQRHLLEVGVIRIGLPAARDLPPMIDWPDEIRDVIGHNVHMIGGGIEFDGRPIVPLDENALRFAVNDLKKKNIKTVAICSVFSPISSDVELRAAEIISSELPDVFITLSHEIGRIGLLERENAAIMNASLASLSCEVMFAFSSAFQSMGITAPIYISQNDGTLMTKETVEKYPVLTFASGPTNSMRGAAYLSNEKTAIVADIGGTTTDIGMLIDGFPRESSIVTDIGGVRTNFRMPDIQSIGIGGGSIVRVAHDLSIGPDSVGFLLTHQAKIFGGQTLTLTDIGVASGRIVLGNPENLRDIPSTVVEEVLEEVQLRISESIDRMKSSAAEVPLILVGGGANLIDKTIPGISRVIVPEYADVANAVGAAIAEVSGEVDQVFRYSDVGRHNALEEARNEATEKAIAAGAKRDTIRIVDVEEIPIAYAPGDSIRVKVKAIGELLLGQCEAEES